MLLGCGKFTIELTGRTCEEQSCWVGLWWVGLRDIRAEAALINSANSACLNPKRRNACSHDSREVKCLVKKCPRPYAACDNLGI